MSTVRKPRYSKEEFARRGEEIYQRDIRPHVEPQDTGKIVAIDIETGAYEVAADTVSASERLFQRLPDAQIWFVRVGHRAVHRIGLRPPTAYIASPVTATRNGTVGAVLPGGWVATKSRVWIF
jgi:hypothetical protein